MPALARQQRPSSPTPGAVIRAAVIVLAIAVAIVPVPYRTTRRVGLEQRVGDADRVKDQRIIGAAQTEANELQKLGADELVTRNAATVSTVMDRDDLMKDFRPFEDLHRQYQHVIAGYAEPFGERRAGDRRPSLDIAVPEIRELHCPVTGRWRQQVGAGDKRGNADRESERVDPGALLPTILLGGGAGARNKAERPPHHVLDFDARQRLAFVEHCGEQHRKCGFVELDALPKSSAPEPLILIPVAIIELCRNQIA